MDPRKPWALAKLLLSSKIMFSSTDLTKDGQSTPVSRRQSESVQASTLQGSLKARLESPAKLSRSWTLSDLSILLGKSDNCQGHAAVKMQLLARLLSLPKQCPPRKSATILVVQNEGISIPNRDHYNKGNHCQLAERFC